MALLEVVKHTRKIWSIAMVKEKQWFHKVGEILIEIAIIVFAISFSLFIEHQREESADHKLEKEFLSGLTTDLKHDRGQLDTARDMYRNMGKAFNYFSRMSDTTTIKADSINLYYNYLISSTDFLPESAHYQALKSTGKLYVIEDKKLLNRIIDLYENKMPSLTYAIRFMNDKKENGIVAFMDTHLKIEGKRDNFRETVTNPIARNYLRKGGYMTAILMQFDETMKAIDGILSDGTPKGE